MILNDLKYSNKVMIVYPMNSAIPPDVGTLDVCKPLAVGDEKSMPTLLKTAQSVKVTINEIR